MKKNQNLILDFSELRNIRTLKTWHPPYQIRKFQIVEYEKGKLSLLTSSQFFLVEMPHHRELPLSTENIYMKYVLPWSFLPFVSWICKNLLASDITAAAASSFTSSLNCFALAFAAPSDTPDFLVWPFFCFRTFSSHRLANKNCLSCDTNKLFEITHQTYL